MKQLKLVALSMSMFGFISCPVFADTSATDMQAQPQAQATVKHKHHHKVKHHHAAHHASSMRAMTAMPVQPVMVVETPKIDTYQNVMDRMEQNLGRAKPMADWFNRVGLSGGINADAHWGNRSMGFNGENVARLSVNDAYLNLNAHVNDCVKAFLGLSFANPSATLTGAPATAAAFVPGVTYPKPGQYSNVYANNALRIEQAYITFGMYDNVPCFPVYFEIGKQFQDFGRYVIHPLVRSFTQVMSESLQTDAKVGFLIPAGLHGDVYAFQDPMTKVGKGHTGTIWGAGLGWDRLSEDLGFGIGVSYMSNLTGVGDIANSIGRSNGSSIVGVGTYVHTVGGIAVYGDVNSGPFSLSARYTTAIQKFNPADLSTTYFVAAGNGASPWTGDLTAAYGFMGWNHNQNVYVGYQVSNNAVNLFLPKNRWLVGYGIEAYKNTNLGLEWDHDTDYSSKNGASGKTPNTLGARVAVKFG